MDSPNPKPTHPSDPGASTETYISAFVAVVCAVIGIANSTQTPDDESHASCAFTAFTTIRIRTLVNLGGTYGMQ